MISCSIAICNGRQWQKDVSVGTGESAQLLLLSSALVPYSCSALPQYLLSVHGKVVSKYSTCEDALVCRAAGRRVGC